MPLRDQLAEVGGGGIFDFINKKLLTKLRSLKTALMQDLLTGKMRVTSLLTEPQEAGA